MSRVQEVPHRWNLTLWYPSCWRDHSAHAIIQVHLCPFMIIALPNHLLSDTYLRVVVWGNQWFIPLLRTLSYQVFWGIVFAIWTSFFPNTTAPRYYSHRLAVDIFPVLGLYQRYILDHLYTLNRLFKVGKAIVNPDLCKEQRLHSIISLTPSVHASQTLFDYWYFCHISRLPLYLLVFLFL